MDPFDIAFLLRPLRNAYNSGLTLSSHSLHRFRHVYLVDSGKPSESLE